jgi:predicted component of type VI protein secretion system
VVAHTLSEMDGSVWQNKVAAFRLVPYFAQEKIELPPNLHSLIDISKATLEKLVSSEDDGKVNIYKDEDFSFDKVMLRDKISHSETNQSSSEEEDNVRETESESEEEIGIPLRCFSKRLKSNTT